MLIFDMSLRPEICRLQNIKQKSPTISKLFELPSHKDFSIKFNFLEAFCIKLNDNKDISRQIPYMIYLNMDSLSILTLP